MSLFKKHSETGETTEATQESKPKRAAHAFRQVPPYPIDEELADRIAMRAYGDKDEDGKPDIPGRPFPG